MAVSLEKIRFLLVDDNVRMMNLVKAVLRGFGVKHVVEAQTAGEAMARLRAEQIDIMVVEYQLREVDGPSLVRQIRTAPDSPAPFLPVIMLTAHTERSRVETARDAGITEFCSKPISPKEMLRKIAAVIDQPRPYVRATDFVGPDRRRRAASGRTEPNRRAEQEPREI